ncbi:unnamed protein product [Caenorhabditis sp. 36 PRJEB53466]|nr:unnamed protein product [Caenorhabditis sp. 36 PRJEB53466]
MQFWSILFFILALMVVLITPVQSASDADISTLLALKDKVTDFLAGSNLSPQAKAKIQSMVEKKQADVENALSRK